MVPTAAAGTFSVVGRVGARTPPDHALSVDWRGMTGTFPVPVMSSMLKPG